MKLVRVVLWLSVLHIMMFREDTLASDNINLGAIFTLDTINGQVSQIAMKAAVDDINSDPNILGARNLSLQIHDSNYNGFLSIMGGKFLLHLLSCTALLNWVELIVGTPFFSNLPFLIFD